MPSARMIVTTAVIAALVYVGMDAWKARRA